MLAYLLLIATLTGVAARQATTVEIAPGVSMPILNLGTCCGSDPSIGVPAWFAAGGAGIDTAWDYHDEPAIAKVLKSSGRKRSDFFLTTKIPAGVGARSNGTDCKADPHISLNYIKDNLKQLELDYVDLVLLHGPCRFAQPPVPDATAADNALWKGLQMAKEQGLTRAIGVSNYNSAELEALEGAVPAVNQCQMSVGKSSTTLPMPHVAHDDATIEYCRTKGITYQAWRVIGGCPMKDPRVTAIASAHGKSSAQVCLRWVMQQGAIIAAGTGSNTTKAQQHSEDDFAILNFTLTAAEMDMLSKISPPSGSDVVNSILV